MTRSTLALALASGLCLAHSASAYVATTGLDPAINVSGTAPQAGSEYTVTGGDFLNYTATNPGDPTITGGDLAFYRFTADAFLGTITGNTVPVTGTYRIFYDLNRDGIYEAASEPTVSFGNVDLNITVAGTTPFPFGFLNGTLTQTAGPSGPGAGNFTSLPSPASVVGSFLATNANGNASFEATLNSAVPEPGTWAMVIAGAAGLVGVQRLRRRSASL